MASRNKTSYLNLNQWAETDKPTRADFVSDNSIIDTKLGGHLEDLNKHLTTAEKSRVSSPFSIKIVQGTDDNSRTINFSFTPQIVICFALDSSPMEVNSGTVTINWGIAVKNYGGSGGCELSGADFVVSQTTQSGIKYNLNNSDFQYVVVGFR